MGRYILRQFRATLERIGLVATDHYYIVHLVLGTKIFTNTLHVIHTIIGEFLCL